MKNLSTSLNRLRFTWNLIRISVCRLSNLYFKCSTRSIALQILLSVFYGFSNQVNGQQNQLCDLPIVSESRQVAYMGNWLEMIQQGGDSPICEEGSYLDNDFQYVIPIVVHVIHNNGPENISDEQIMDAINDCNQGYWWQSGQGQRLNIKLVLARVDPEGNCTTGINRVEMDQIIVAPQLASGLYCDEIIGFSDLVSQVEWWNGQYLNIYIVGGITSSSECFVPSESFAGPQGTGYPPYWPWISEEDGIILDYRKTGYIEEAANNESFTLPHELGHYLGLIHPHGPGADAIFPCNPNHPYDYVDSTPRQSITYFFTPCNAFISSCEPDDIDDMGSNLMEYALRSNAGCGTFLMGEQIERAKCFLENHTERSYLWSEPNLEWTGVRINCVEASAAIVCNSNLEQLEFNAEPYFSDLDYLWAFGDGTTSNSASGLHDYSVPGLYQVTLTVTDQCGELTVYDTLFDFPGCVCVDSQLSNEVPITQEIVVTQTACSTFEFEISDCFNDYDISWDLGDGTVVDQLTVVSHQYCMIDQGPVDVVLNVSDGLGNNQTIQTAVFLDCTIGEFEVITIPIPCEDSCEGVFQLTATEPFDFSWDNVTGDDESTIQLGPQIVKVSGICENSYIATITWGNGCSQTILQDFYSMTPTTSGDLIIDSETDLLDYLGSHYFTGNVIIAEDVTLSGINWYFNENKNLTVNSGVTAEISNFNLEGCSGKWKGIEVLSINDVPGVLEIENGTIKEAYIGIATEDSSPNYTVDGAIYLPVPGEVIAGQISASNVSFENNLRAVQVADAISENENQNTFVNCEFTVSDALYFQLGTEMFDFSIAAERFNSHVRFDHVSGYNFFGCSFLNDLSDASYFPQGWSQRGTGVQLWDSKIVIDKVPDLPESESRFRGFRFGISEFVTNDPWNGFRVLNSRFDNNQIGLVMQGVCFHDVIGNQFNIGPNSSGGNLVLPEILQNAVVDYEGLFQLDGAFYIIAENDFQAIDAPVGDNFFIGARIRDTDARDNEIYHNSFADLTRGCQAEGDNSGNGQWANFGLRFVCNDFDNCLSDITVTEFDGLDIAQVSIEQFGLEHDSNGAPVLFSDVASLAEDGLVAANTFSQIGIPDQDDFGHFFSYADLLTYWCGQGTECPSEELVLNVIAYTPLNENSGNDCEPVSGVIVEGVSQYFESVPTVWEDNSDANDDVIGVNEYLLASLIDGGDTDDLIDDVDFAWVEDTWAMRQELLSKSPYLSESVLKAVATNTITFPHPVALEIFIANPDVLRKASFIEYLKTKPDPMPQYMIDLLLASRDQSTLRTMIHRNLMTANAVKSQYNALFNRIWRRDYSLNIASIQSSKDLRTARDYYAIIDSKLAAGSFVEAEDLYLIMPDSVDMTGRDLSNYDSYIDWIDLQIDQDDWKDAEHITAAEWTALEDLASTQWMYRSGQNALAFLMKHTDYHHIIPAVRNHIIQRSERMDSGAEDSELKVYPNPASQLLNVELPPSQGAFTLEIMDITGKVVLALPSSTSTKFHTLDVSHLKSGMYFIRAFDTSNNEQSHVRFEIIH